MDVVRIVVAAVAVTFACSCDGSGSGRSDDVLPEVLILHDASDAKEDPGVADGALADPIEEPADPGTADDPASDPGLPDLAVQDLPGDPGWTDEGTVDPGAPDPGAPDPGGQDVVLPGSKTPGQYCEVASECANGAYCVAGQYTHAQCNPGCTVDADCAAVTPTARGQCTAVEGLPFNVCIWLCGILGGLCPGDGQCDGAACR